MVAEKVQNRTRGFSLSLLSSLNFCSPWIKLALEDFFYKIWPLSRFVGYRPPAFPDFDDSFHSKLIYQLPTKYHERHIAQLREQAENNDKERNGSSQPRHSGETLVDEEGKKAKGEKEEKEKNKTKMQKFGDKSIHMLHTYIASFAAIAFLALCEFAISPEETHFDFFDLYSCTSCYLLQSRSAGSCRCVRNRGGHPVSSVKTSVLCLLFD